MGWRDESAKILAFVQCNFERLKFPLDDRTDPNFIVPLRMHFLRSKSTFDNLKSVFNGLGGNRRWVPRLQKSENKYNWVFLAH